MARPEVNSTSNPCPSFWGQHLEIILEGLANAQRLFEHGTMEERKRVVRAFVEGLTIDGATQSGEIRMKKLPAPDVPSTGSSFDLVAGARLVADSDKLPMVAAHWRYDGIKHSTRKLVRVGLTA